MMMRIYLLVGMVSVISAGKLLSCGISWKTPTNHFDSVNERGFLSFWDQFGTFDFGNNLQIPLIVNFRSNRDTLSPYAGYGWLVPLLESNVVQLEENRFMLVQPDGWNRYFGRAKASDTTLLGDGDWAAELNGSTFTAWAPCGWKLIYVNGKISSMVSPDNRRFDWIKNGDRVTEIREAGTARLVVKWNQIGTEMLGIEADGKQFAFERSAKPRVQTVAKQNLVATIDASLSKVLSGDGSVKSYEFGVDNLLNPNLKIGDRLMTWNPETKHVSSDGDWKYQITPVQDGGYAAIGRKNDKNQSEFWHNDRNKGIEVIQGVDGVKKTIRSFVNGKLARKIRSVTHEVNGNSTIVYQASYDDLGRLLRTSNGSNVEEYRYEGQSDKIQTIDLPGKQWTLGYNQRGDLESARSSDGTLLTFLKNLPE